jgi:hypothetical protein
LAKKTGSPLSRGRAEKSNCPDPTGKCCSNEFSALPSLHSRSEWRGGVGGGGTFLLTLKSPPPLTPPRRSAGGGERAAFVARQCSLARHAGSCCGGAVMHFCRDDESWL